MPGFGGGLSAPAIPINYPIYLEPSNTYNVSGSLIATLTTSGTWNPPEGLSVATVVVVGGGAPGNGGTGDINNGYYLGGNGGTGGQVRVAKISITGSVSYTIGGSETNTTFAGITAYGGRGSTEIPFNSYRLSSETMPWNLNASRGGRGGYRPAAGVGGVKSASAGQAGVLVNGIYYAGGGGGGGYLNAGAAGGLGGGGGNTVSFSNGTPGTNGTGGGGGGGTADQIPYSGGLGGSGVVLIYSG